MFGTIVLYRADRGFGFILPEGEPSNGKDLFFHRTNVDGSGFDALREGELVTYELGTDERRGTPSCRSGSASCASAMLRLHVWTISIALQPVRWRRDSTVLSRRWRPWRRCRSQSRR